MRVFNLAEELEKERKKNKELEERNKVLEKGCKEYRYHIKQMNKIHDNCLNTIEELQDRIDKAIDFLESMDYCGQEDYFCDKTTVDADPNGNNNSYYDSAERLYKILKGE